MCVTKAVPGRSSYRFDSGTLRERVSALACLCDQAMNESNALDCSRGAFDEGPNPRSVPDVAFEEQLEFVCIVEALDKAHRPCAEASLDDWRAAEDAQTFMSTVRPDDSHEIVEH